ncbi:acyl-CoA dehydrogenase family protein [Niallia endozanthoxylica]|uniref:Acyl-CoA dehydrogenase n=1 Tax=Niallia endozanthoxylica TaxID=2036016 RepID=A0A5J5I1N9_9BACI|nr:acyl-CoA dehydrogenase family protein [Niallia endozanthoxylica]KAA9028515.1 acyl-CoA dehydrogenase [Niallia endozanthoxylica]
MSNKTVNQQHFLSVTISPNDVFTTEDFTEEQLMISDMTSKFVLNEVLPRLGKIENKEFSHTVDLIKQAGELGLISADIPESDGGLELGKVAATIITEKMALGRSFSITFGGQTGIGALPIAYFGTEQQKQKYLLDILTGEKIAAYALTEPSAGTDALSGKTTAVLSECGSYYVISGEKQWISNAGFADLFIVYAKVNGTQFTAFIVEKDYEGVTTSPEEKKMGLEGSSTCSVILDNVKVPVENVIGEIGKGHVIAFNVLNIGRHKISAASLGTAKRAIELSVKYANERKQFGQSLSNFNLIKNKIADMVIKTYVNESAVYRTAGAMQDAFAEMKRNGDDIGKTIARYAVECSINKVMSTEILDFVVDEGVQIHGGYGYMSEYEIETLYRDARISRIFEGTNEINRIIIASSLLKKDLQPIENENVEGCILQHEKQILLLLKNLFHSLILTIKKQGLDYLDEEQETAAFIADIAINIYAIESAILRTKKAIQANGEEKSQQKIYCTKIYVHESSQQLGLRALNLLNHFIEDEGFSQISKRLIMSSPEDIVKLKRRIALETINAGKYIN